MGCKSDVGWHEYFVRSLPLKKFKRIQFAQEPGWQMDCVKDMNRAEIFWKEGINEAAEALKEFCAEG